MSTGSVLKVHAAVQAHPGNRDELLSAGRWHSPCDMSAFTFTLLVDGVDLLSDEAQEQLEALAVPPAVGLGTASPGLTRRSLPYRGGDFFEDALFGREGDVQYATFRLEAPTEEVAMQWAAAMLVHALPGLRVVAADTGRRGSVDIR